MTARGRGRRRRRSVTPFRRRVRRRVSRARSRRGRLSIRQLLPYPERFKTSLIYTEDFALDPAQGTASWQLMNAASLFDPNYSGTGHQPLYFDNLSEIYNKYIVRVCYITVTVQDVNVNTTNAESKRGRLFIVRDVVAADITGMVPGLLQEEKCPNIKWRYFGTNLTGRMCRLRFKCAPYKQARVAYNDPSLSAVVTTNPAQQCFLGVGIAGASTLQTDPPACLVNIRLTYKCEFFDRKITQPEN